MDIVSLSSLYCARWASSYVGIRGVGASGVLGGGVIGWCCLLAEAGSLRENDVCGEGSDDEDVSAGDGLPGPGGVLVGDRRAALPVLRNEAMVWPFTMLCKVPLIFRICRKLMEPDEYNIK